MEGAHHRHKDAGFVPDDESVLHAARTIWRSGSKLRRVAEDKAHLCTAPRFGVTGSRREPPAGWRGDREDTPAGVRCRTGHTQKLGIDTKFVFRQWQQEFELHLQVYGSVG